MGRALFLCMIFTSWAPAQSIELPTKISGGVGSFIVIRPAKLTGKAVKYVTLDDGLAVFPSSLLTDQTVSVVVASKPGKYRVLAYTAEGDKPSDPSFCVIEVGDPPAPPAPPSPPPDPSDPLAETLRGIFGGIQDNDKLGKAKKLGAIYKQGAKLARDPDISTAGQLLTAIRAAGKLELSADDLRPIRDRVADELGKVLPTDPAIVLSQENRKQGAELLERLASIMEGMR